MPAPSAFLITQTAVVATSVLLLQIDWGFNPKDARKGQPVVRSTGTQSAVPAIAQLQPESSASTPTATAQETPPVPADALVLSPVEPPPAVPLQDPFPSPDLPTSSAYDIAADAASNFDLNSERVVFTGNVRLKSKRFVLKAERLTVSIDPKKNEMRKMVANGNVQVTVNGDGKEPGYTGSAWEASFDPNTDIITLGGWPRIRGGGREHRALDSGTKMLLTTIKPKLTTQGRASTLITGEMAKAAQAAP